MKDKADAVKCLYRQRDKFILIGLTGRTGAGCTTVAKILSTDNINELDLKDSKTCDFKHSDERKYSIVYRFMAEDERWKKFTVIEASSIIFSFILEGTYKNLFNYIDKISNEVEIKEKEELKVLKNEKSVTKDGHEVELAGNIGGFKDVEGVLTNGGEGVGLFRTEFLYMDSDHFPTEDEQFEAYKQVLEGMQGKKVVVRTLDIGGDKHLSYYEFPQEMNPFLGYRAIRLCLKETDIFKTQLRALCRASVYGRLCIMFPMIATVKEFCDAKAIFEEVKAELVAEGVAVSDSIEVGMMVEIPAAAVLADQFAKYADFFSIGTNDLIQYSMAADRMSEHVSYLYQPYNPSVLRLVANTIKGAHEHGKWVGMCGAMAGEPHAVPILLGLGLDEFSMSATQILKARKVVKSLSYEEMQGLAQECLNKDTADEVLETVKTKLGE